MSPTSRATGKVILSKLEKDNSDLKIFIATSQNIVIKTEQIFSNHKVNNWWPLELYKVISTPGDDHQVTQSKEVSVR